MKTGLWNIPILGLMFLASTAYAVPVSMSRLSFSITDKSGETKKQLKLIGCYHEEKRSILSQKYTTLLKNHLQSHPLGSIGVLIEAIQSEPNDSVGFLNSSYQTLARENFKVVAADVRRMKWEQPLLATFNKLRGLIPTVAQASCDPTQMKRLIMGLETLEKQTRAAVRIGEDGFSTDQFIAYVEKTKSESQAELTLLVNSHFPQYSEAFAAAEETLLGKIRTSKEALDSKLKKLGVSETERAEDTILALVLNRFNRALKGGCHEEIAKELADIVTFAYEFNKFSADVLNIAVASQTVKNLASSDQVIVMFGGDHTEALRKFLEVLFSTKDQAVEFQTYVEEKSSFQDSEFYVSKNPARISIHFDTFRKLLSEE